MADSTVLDATKMKVVDLRKELKSRGLPHTGDKAELVARLQTALAQDDHQDINLDSDEIDSDSVLEEEEKLDDDDEKSQTDILDDSAVDTINEELALADQPAPKLASEVKPLRTLKRKITADSKESKEENKEAGSKKIVLNRAISVTPAVKLDAETTQSQPEVTAPTDNKIKITADIDVKTRLEMRAKRFGLPVKISDNERKEARKQRFGQNTSSAITSNKTPATLSENFDKLKQRAERFGQSVSKIMTDIELKERIEKRKAKFGTVK
ncbi:SAP domain-containing ribonucleoprotein [Cydia strobilella]|uniref:SAP domain-containing ribonucleoprotein n=1 Tax=Cydia strobilella TaxID=1100964 RepID=UPI003004A505